MRTPTLEVIYNTTPDRLNEDAWIALPVAAPLGASRNTSTGSDRERTLIAAIDGATTRLTPPPLQAYLDTLPGRLTPAAYSARTVRDALIRQVVAGPLPELRALVLGANAVLGRELATIVGVPDAGALTLDALQFPPEVYATLAHDPRLVRLGLPASVMTLGVHDPAANALHYIHLGDTLLLVAYCDGRVDVPTDPGALDPNAGLKQAFLTMREQQPDASLRELTQSPEVQRRNLHAGLSHNYVDEYGLPQPSQGVGVLDGLPELRYFLHTGTVALDEVAWVCVMSDGLEWPASAEEIFASDPDHITTLRQQRYAHMAREIETRGLSGYLRLLRDTETADADHERFPRMKTHDDATGVLLRFGAVEA